MHILSDSEFWLKNPRKHKIKYLCPSGRMRMTSIYFQYRTERHHTLLLALEEAYFSLTYWDITNHTWRLNNNSGGVVQITTVALIKDGQLRAIDLGRLCVPWISLPSLLGKF